MDSRSRSDIGQVPHLNMKLAGNVIRYLLFLVNNYGGKDSNFVTLDEYRAKASQLHDTTEQLAQQLTSTVSRSWWTWRRAVAPSSHCCTYSKPSIRSRCISSSMLRMSPWYAHKICTTPSAAAGSRSTTSLSMEGIRMSSEVVCQSKRNISFR